MSDQFELEEVKPRSKNFLAQKLTRPPRLTLLFSLILSIMGVVVVASLIFIPWRQTVIGQGEVAIFDPLDRPQTVDSQIKGRLVEVLVKEGQTVEKGQVLARLEDRDSKFLDPRQAERLQGQISALQEKRQATQARIAALRAQIEAIEASRTAKLASAQAKVDQASQKLAVDQQMIRVGEQDLKTAQLQENRIRKLEEAGLKSRRDYELTVQKRVEAETKLQKLQGDVLVARQEVGLNRLEAAKIEAEASEKVQKSLESISKA
ncbi:MAG TPA: biotin/lipoyl-binding protein, partial [Phycisphaerales bacterium]|nr:biotin/lipoyl-binding protein [Phycisphaerales bacterium]